MHGRCLSYSPRPPARPSALRSVRGLALAGLIAGSTLPGATANLEAQVSSSDYTEPHQRRALDIYRTLIAFRSAAGHGQVPAVAEYLARQFRDAGWPAEDVHVLPLVLPDGEETASLVVRYRGDGSSGEDPVLMIAHMDVVDALPEDWERDPFTLVEEEGYFFGRGTLDDKFGVTTLTSTFLRLREEGFVPTRDLILAFTGDEETGMLTTRALVEEHRALTDAAFALNADGGGGVLNEAGEPVQFDVQTAEKTYATFELTVTNPGGHSSMPRADNAIYQLAEALRRIEAHRFPVRSNETTRLYFQNAARAGEGEVARAMARFAENPDDREAAEVLRGVPDLVGLTRTTCVATMLRAGHAENALPQSATATVNCRIFPGVEVAEVERTLRRVALGREGADAASGETKGAAGPAGPDDAHFRIEVLDDPVASPASPIREDVMEAVRVGVERIHPGTPITPYMAPYGTDGKEIRRGGIPTYGVMGLFVKGSDIFAHGLNERVTVKAFYDALEYWYAVMTHLAGRPTS